MRTCTFPSTLNVFGTSFCSVSIIARRLYFFMNPLIDASSRVCVRGWEVLKNSVHTTYPPSVCILCYAHSFVLSVKSFKVFFFLFKYTFRCIKFAFPLLVRHLQFPQAHSHLMKSFRVVVVQHRFLAFTADMYARIHVRTYLFFLFIYCTPL